MCTVASPEINDGGPQVYACLQDLYLDFEAVRIANTIDNKKVLR
jgi:hypothetical protein